MRKLDIKQIEPIYAREGGILVNNAMGKWSKGFVVGVVMW